MTLMRFHPFRELDRLAEQTLSVGARGLRSMPMEALRRGDAFIVHLDVPGVGLDDIDERPHGEFARQHAASDRPRFRRAILRGPDRRRRLRARPQQAAASATELAPA